MKRGQMSVINIMYIVVAGIVLFTLLPTITSFGNDAKNDMVASGFSNASMVGGIIDLIPFFILLGLVITVIIYANPPREQGY